MRRRNKNLVLMLKFKEEDGSKMMVKEDLGVDFFMIEE
jgi:hypothetical protein